MIDLDLSAPSGALRHTPFGTTLSHLNVPLDAEGTHHGYLTLAYAEHSRGPVQLALPVCIVRGRHTGPTVTFLAGIHGDEPEGSVVLMSLARELDYRNLTGTVIVLPCLNMAALQNGQRTNPVDGKNIDISFPGKPEGTMSDRLAFEVMQHFINPAELVVDLRSGGQHLIFDPSAAVRFTSQGAKREYADEIMLAFGAPNSTRLPPSGTTQSLQGAVDALGKMYLQTELGGGAGYKVQTIDIARAGCRNVLRHLKMLDDNIELSSTRLLEVRDDSYYVHATRSGLFEPCAHLGHQVWKGNTLAQLWEPQDTRQEPSIISVPRDGILLATHHGGWVESGDIIAVLAEEVQA